MEGECVRSFIASSISPEGKTLSTPGFGQQLKKKTAISPSSVCYSLSSRHSVAGVRNSQLEIWRYLDGNHQHSSLFRQSLVCCPHKAVAVTVVEVIAFGMVNESADLAAGEMVADTAEDREVPANQGSVSGPSSPGSSHQHWLLVSLADSRSFVHHVR